MTTPHVQVRRVYDPPHADDGYRVLVDRLWPRGLSKQRAHRYRFELDEPERAAAFSHLRTD